ncbi:MAG: hypothetical protein EPO27_10625 [Betaproteobacteria bacterium]|nr:MAG: hypothetical protein EPO27_10625 [Betaproteobacteria bacterium]
MARKVNVTEERLELTAVDRASAVVKGLQNSVGGLRSQYVALAGAVTAALGAGGMGAFLSDAIRVRSALDDLADTTGDNVRTLDGLRRQAYVSGVELEAMGGALTKLARNLNNADDEGQAAAQALKAIGLNVESLRTMKPADAMLEVARALDKFADGSGKVAVAQALMGKEGAKQLPLLKDLAEAGALQGKITAQQAAEAERIEKEWRKLVLAFKDGKDAIATWLIPEIGNLIEQMREGIRIAGGFGAALRIFGTSGAFSSPHEIITSAQEDIAQMEQGLGTMRGLRGYDAQIALTERRIADARKRIEFAKFLQRQDALSGRTGDEMLDARDLRARHKPVLDPGKLGGKERDKKDNALTASQIARMTAESWEDFDKEVRQGIVALQEWEAAGRKAIEDHNKKLEAEGIAGWIKLAETMQDAADTMVYTWDQFGNRIEVTAERWKEMQDEAQKTKDFARDLGLTFTSAFEDAIVEGKNLRDVVKGLGQDVARIITRKTVTEPLGKAIGGFVEGIDWKGIFGFATGGDFTVGGAGGTDSQLVAFRATPGERVSVRTPEQADGGVTVIQHINFAVGIRGEVRAELAAQLPRIAEVSRAAVLDARLRGRPG